MRLREGTREVRSVGRGRERKPIGSPLEGLGERVRGVGAEPGAALHQRGGRGRRLLALSVGELSQSRDQRLQGPGVEHERDAALELGPGPVQPGDLLADQLERGLLRGGQLPRVQRLLQQPLRAPQLGQVRGDGVAVGLQLQLQGGDALQQLLLALVQLHAHGLEGPLDVLAHLR